MARKKSARQHSWDRRMRDKKKSDKKDKKKEKKAQRAAMAAEGIDPDAPITLEEFEEGPPELPEVQSESPDETALAEGSDTSTDAEEREA